MYTLEKILVNNQGHWNCEPKVHTGPMNSHSTRTVETSLRKKKKERNFTQRICNLVLSHKVWGDIHGILMVP